MMVHDLLGSNLAGLLSLLLFIPLIDAQTSPVTCLTTWDWTLNSKQQTPCLVAAYLLAPCADGQWNVPALQSGQYYSPPILSQATNCICSTVTYSLMSACGYCQGESIVAWSTWKTNCTESMTSISSYPKPIPPATAVPAWAYLDVVTGDKFDETAADNDINAPESTAGGATTTQNSTSSTQSPTPTNAGSSSSSKSNNLPAIIGGSVGGVVGLGLIICLFIYLMKRKSSKSHVPPSAEFSKVMPPGTPMPMGFDPAAVGFRSKTASPMSNGLSSDANIAYNPNGTPMHQNGPGYFANGGSPPPAFQGSPWSPPPVRHTPAPSAGAYSYTPPPPGMNTNIYTPPPGSGPVPSMVQYSHGRTNSGSVAYTTNTSPHQSMTNPYGPSLNSGHNRNPSYPAHPGVPEM